MTIKQDYLEEAPEATGGATLCCYSGILLLLGESNGGSVGEAPHHGGLLHQRVGR